jgi:hypothetical protein
MVRPKLFLLVIVSVVVGALVSPVLKAGSPEVSYEDGAGTSMPAPPYPFKNKWTEGGIVTEKGSPVSFFHLTRADHDGDLDKEVVATSSGLSFLSNPLLITKEDGGIFTLVSIDVEDIDTSCYYKTTIIASFKEPSLETVGLVTVAGPETVNFQGPEWTDITSVKIIGGTCGGGWFGIGSDVWIDNITLGGTDSGDKPLAEETVAN